MGRSRNHRGFTLVEAAVAIGVVAILAGMLAPMGMKVLDRQREEATRKSVQMIFEALFGSKERRVENLRADSRWNPHYPDNGDYWVSLEEMVNRGHRPGFIYPRVFASNRGLPEGQPPQAFAWGWRGPYWLGPVSPRLEPLDAWGRPIRLFVRTAGNVQTVQVRSDGRTGSEQQTDSHINYPITPVPLRNFNCNIILNITRGAGLIYRGYYCLRGAGFGSIPGAHAWQREWPFELPRRNMVNDPTFRDTYTFTDVIPGSMDVCFVPDIANGANFDAFAVPLDVLPGETREVEVSISRRP